jgi:hypothetical protein
MQIFFEPQYIISGNEAEGEGKIHMSRMDELFRNHEMNSEEHEIKRSLDKLKMEIRRFRERQIEMRAAAEDVRNKEKDPYKGGNSAR